MPKKRQKKEIICQMPVFAHEDNFIHFSCQQTKRCLKKIKPKPQFSTAIGKIPVIFFFRLGNETEREL